jgi:AraC-like DNA-binding protein
MRDLTQFPILTPELLLSSGPLSAPPGPVRFMLAGQEERTRLTILHECLARLGLNYDIDCLQDMALHCDFAMNVLPGLAMAQGRIHGSRHSPAKHADDDTNLVVVINLRGPLLVEQRGKALVLGEGDAVMISGADPSCCAQKSDGELLAFRFPKVSFAPLVNGVSDRIMQIIPPGTPALNLLRNYAGVAFGEQTHASRGLGHLVATHIFDLMAVAVGASRDADHAAQNGGLRAARLQAIKIDIARHLEDVDFSVADVAARNNCTPRYVQRLFEMEGMTFTEYVLTQRLARAHRLLIDPRRERDKISAVAYDCGFNDVSYFNRAFRRQFAAAPSDVREQARKAVPSGLM